MANTTTTKVNRLGLTHRQTVMIVLLLVGTFVTVLNQTVVAPALPSIMVDMSINAATGQWLTTGFTLVNAIMVPVTAFLIDRFPIRNLFMFSMSIFAIGSLLAAWGPNFPVLLCGRIVQAVGAGVLMPMVMSVLMLYRIASYYVVFAASAVGFFFAQRHLGQMGAEPPKED